MKCSLFRHLVPYVVLVACVHPARTQIDTTRGASLVPPTAPDTIPAWMYADSNLIHDTPQMTGSFPKNIIALLFKPGTAQTLMQAAVDSVRGVVVGGLQPLNVYYILVPSDTTGKPLFAAIAKLQRMRQVSLATPSVLAIGPSSSTIRRSVPLTRD